VRKILWKVETSSLKKSKVFNDFEQHIGGCRLAEEQSNPSFSVESSLIFCDFDEENKLQNVNLEKEHIEMKKYSDSADVVQEGEDNASVEVERYTDKMYHNAQMLADKGNQGEGLFPPKEVFTPCLSCNDKEELNMEAEFRNVWHRWYF
jgi:hypothetical protein